MENKRKLLSIIIPYYNSGKYCDELLDVLDAQMADNVQVIVVDDGSNKPFKTKYAWVEHYRKENGGVSSARNEGLRHATGQYIAFIDSDDLVSENYIETVIDYIKQYKFDYCYMSWKTIGSGWRYEKILKDDSDCFEGWNCCVWNRVYKRCLVKDVFFNEAKQIAEDAEYIAEAEVRCKKKVCIKDVLYYYRSDVPDSLTKRFANGEIDMERIVYNVKSVTKELVDEVKTESKKSEVIVMTRDNSFPELSRYAMVIPPSQIKGTELRGEYTSLFSKIQKPLFTQVVIWTDKTFRIGGIETFIYNYCLNLKDDYDILVLYNEMDAGRINRLLPHVRVMKNDLSKKIVCDTLLINRIGDVPPKNIKYKQCVQMVHTCRLNDAWTVPTNRDFVVYPTNVVKDSYSVDGVVINNFRYEGEVRRPLRLISATRLTEEKGEERMIALANILIENGIPFVWEIFAERPLKKMPDGMVFINPKMNIMDYMVDCDYLVQLSDSEAFCYSIVEALSLGIKVITTPIPVLKEIGVVDGLNGIVVPFDMSNIDVSRIYGADFVEVSVDNSKIKKQWRRILGNTTPKHDYVYENQIVNVVCKKRYKDLLLGRAITPGEIISVVKDRAEELIKAGVCKNV